MTNQPSCKILSMGFCRWLLRAMAAAPVAFLLAVTVAMAG